MPERSFDHEEAYRLWSTIAKKNSAEVARLMDVPATSINSAKHREDWEARYRRDVGVMIGDNHIATDAQISGYFSHAAHTLYEACSATTAEGDPHWMARIKAASELLKFKLEAQKGLNASATSPSSVTLVDARTIEAASSLDTSDKLAAVAGVLSGNVQLANEERSRRSGYGQTMKVGR